MQIKCRSKDLKNQNVTLVSFSPLCWSNQSLILILTNGVTLQKSNCHVFSNAGIITCAAIVLTVFLNVSLSLCLYIHTVTALIVNQAPLMKQTTAPNHTQAMMVQAFFFFIHCFIHTLIIVSYGRMLYSILLHKRPQIIQSRNQHLCFFSLVNRRIELNRIYSIYYIQSDFYASIWSEWNQHSSCVILKMMFWLALLCCALADLSLFLCVCVYAHMHVKHLIDIRCQNWHWNIWAIFSLI